MKKNNIALKEAILTKFEYKPIKIEYKHRGTVDFDDNLQGYNETEKQNTETIIIWCFIALIFLGLLSTL